LGCAAEGRVQEGDLRSSIRIAPTNPLSSIASLTARSDAELVARCREGDDSAWAELVERFSRYVYAIAIRVYGLPSADAEDVFQETFARLYEGLDDLRDDTAVKSWIAQVARRLAVDRLRAAARESPADEPLDPSDAEERIADVDEAMAVHDALGILPEHCREILDRFFARDESYRTISDALAIPPGTVASRISRCLAKLKAELE
jgi:RNA polymerase sigma factor (sigma-70 family)